MNFASHEQQTKGDDDDDDARRTSASAATEAEAEPEPAATWTAGSAAGVASGGKKEKGAVEQAAFSVQFQRSE